MRRRQVNLLILSISQTTSLRQFTQKSYIFLEKKVSMWFNNQAEPLLPIRIVLQVENISHIRDIAFTINFYLCICYAPAAPMLFNNPTAVLPTIECILKTVLLSTKLINRIEHLPDHQKCSRQTADCFFTSSIDLYRTKSMLCSISESETGFPGFQKTPA